ncbi:MAG: pyruvate, phosphate dikinase, partial [bacterium]
MSTKKYVYLFAEGNAQMRSLLGGKGANLAEMTKIGLPVPYGFTITTEACNQYYVDLEDTMKTVKEQSEVALKTLEEQAGKIFGDAKNPLLVSVRSGAAISMPGMMDTILNLGLNDISVEAVSKNSGDERFAYDCYRRFIQMFGDVVMKVEHYKFEEKIDAVKEKYGVNVDTEVSADGWKEVIAAYKELIKKETGEEFPQDPKKQLFMAIEAVFSSWNNPRAIVYRKINKIPDELGTAVNVQMMAFGNMGDDCATGVAFTRNPSTGVKELYGEYLVNAQGEDVVAGIRTPHPIVDMEKEMPEAFAEFIRISNILEKHYRDMQDIEFTIEKNKLYVLQTRNGKRTAAAAIKAAVEMVSEGLITKEEALLRVEPSQLNQLLHRRIDPAAKIEVIAKGLPASPGAASGKVVFCADKAADLAGKGEKVLLVSTETTPDDIHGIVAAQGVLTSRGGMTSHAAVVARGMGKPCVCGCEALSINLEQEMLTVAGQTIKDGDIVTIDGADGSVILGQVPTIEPSLTAEFEQLLNWADEVRTLKVRANADNPHDAGKAREFGAEGIGLCRTEHMFMALDRLPAVQEMI